MRCRSCGKKLKKDEYICPDCGTYNTIDDELEETSSSTIQRVESKPKKQEKVIKEVQEKNFQIEDSSGTGKNQFYYKYEDLLEAYIGEDYKLIKKSPFNIWAFLFNWVYLLYRKLYITGIIGLIFSWIVVVFFQKYILIYIVAVSIILGFSFSKYYIFIAKKRVERIQDKEYEETNDDKFLIVNTCREKGGVNVVRALIIYFIFLILIFLCLVPISINTSHNTKFWNENAENLANCTTIVKSAYNNIQKEQALGAIEEAVCKVIKQSKKEYEVYIKTSTNNQEIYSYYITDGGNLFLQYQTTQLEALRIQKEKGTISLENEQLLSELEVIPTRYQKIYDQSLKDDQLIKRKKNKEEKLNFIFEKEEIIR